MCVESRSEKRSTLFRRQPVAEADADAVDPFHAAGARGQFRAEEASIGGLVRDPADGRETQVDRGGCVLALLEVNAVPQDHRAVEREAGLRAVPLDELPDGVIVSALPAGGCKAVASKIPLRPSLQGLWYWPWRASIAVEGGGPQGIAGCFRPEWPADRWFCWVAWGLAESPASQTNPANAAV